MASVYNEKSRFWSDWQDYVSYSKERNDRDEKVDNNNVKTSGNTTGYMNLHKPINQAKEIPDHGDEINVKLEGYLTTYHIFVINGHDKFASKVKIDVSL